MLKRAPNNISCWVLTGAIVLLALFIFMFLLNKNLLEENMQLLVRIPNREIITDIDGNLLVGQKFPDLSLKNIQGEKIRLHSVTSRLKIIILFSLKDCESCLMEAPFWERLYQNSADGRYTVMAIYNAKSMRNLDRFISRNNLTLPILHDAKMRIQSRLKIVSTPLKLVLDQNNRIIFAQTSSYEPEHQQRFMDVLNKLQHGKDN